MKETEIELGWCCASLVKSFITLQCSIKKYYFSDLKACRGHQHQHLTGLYVCVFPKFAMNLDPKVSKI